jgi:hypothetical protein
MKVDVLADHPPFARVDLEMVGQRRIDDVTVQNEFCGVEVEARRFDVRALTGGHVRQLDHGIRIELPAPVRGAHERPALRVVARDHSGERRREDWGGSPHEREKNEAGDEPSVHRDAGRASAAPAHAAVLLLM